MFLHDYFFQKSSYTLSTTHTFYFLINVFLTFQENGTMRALTRLSRQASRAAIRSATRSLHSTPKQLGKIQDITRHPSVWDRSKDERWSDIEMDRYADQSGEWCMLNLVHKSRWCLV